MTSRNGVDAGKALRLLARVDPAWDRGKIAAELGVHPRTVTRWEACQHQPRERNRQALRGLVRHLRQDLVTAPHLHRAGDERLLQALLCLETDGERAEREAIAARLRADAVARRKRDAAEQERRNANARRLRDEVLGRPRRSAFADVDPFLLAGAQPEPALPF